MSCEYFKILLNKNKQFTALDLVGQERQWKANVWKLIHILYILLLVVRNIKVFSNIKLIYLIHLN